MFTKIHSFWAGGFHNHAQLWTTGFLTHLSSTKAEAGHYHRSIICGCRWMNTVIRLRPARRGCMQMRLLWACSPLLSRRSRSLPRVRSRLSLSPGAVFSDFSCHNRALFLAFRTHRILILIFFFWVFLREFISFELRFRRRFCVVCSTSRPAGRPGFWIRGFLSVGCNGIFAQHGVFLDDGFFCCLGA